MGFTPSQIDALSFWEFIACREGWISANTVKEDRAPTPEEHDAMIAKWG